MRLDKNGGRIFTRNKEVLSAKFAVRFDNKQDVWCTLANFEQMYNKIYLHMVAIELPEPVFFYKEGQQMLDEAKAYGCSM